MAIKELKKFGSLKKMFTGKGVVKFEDGAEISAKFTLAQLTSTDLVFTALFKLPADKRETNVISLFGKLNDGRSAAANGLFIKYRNLNFPSNETRITGYASNFQLGNNDLKDDALISFELVNFLFYGDSFQEEIINDKIEARRSLLSLTLDDTKILVKHINDYEKINSELKAQKKAEITCTATTTVKNSTEIEGTTHKVDNLCDLMSIARSTLISWVSYEVIDQSGMNISSVYRNSVVRNFSGNPLIVEHDTKNTKIFIEKAFLVCKTLSDNYKIRQLARSYTETRSGSFIESRSMSIAVLAEYIASIQARLDGKSDFLPTAILEANWGSFKSQMESLLTNVYPEINQKYISIMVSKGFNRRPFSSKLNNLVKKLGIKPVKGEIEKIVTTRNKLAHEGRFSDDETPVKQYLRMQHFIDRIFLRLFDYHGLYYDIENNKINEI